MCAVLLSTVVSCERTGVAINRRRRVAEDQHLYNTELFWPGIQLTFAGTLRGSLNRQHGALLFASLQLLSTLGRGSTGGMGWVSAHGTFREDTTMWTPERLQAALLTQEGRDE